MCPRREIPSLQGGHSSIGCWQRQDDNTNEIVEDLARCRRVRLQKDQRYRVNPSWRSGDTGFLNLVTSFVIRSSVAFSIKSKVS